MDRDLDALPATGRVMAARRGAVKVGMKLSDAVTKLRLRQFVAHVRLEKAKGVGSQ